MIGAITPQRSWERSCRSAQTACAIITAELRQVSCNQVHEFSIASRLL